MSLQPTTVYILGAGCSAGAPPGGTGFPLACEFTPKLADFGQTLQTDRDCRKLKACIDSTVKLLNEESVQTLDGLAARLAAEARDFSNGLTTQQRQTRRRQIADAKVATAALFMYLEQDAKKTGLYRYHNFLDELFGNSTSWALASRSCRCSVLTFNYDRLFEMAFISRFRPDAGQYPLYGKSLLNSGLDYVNGSGIDVDPARFAFLKLHGSVGLRARNEDGEPLHYTGYDGLPGDGSLINDERFFAHANNPNPYERDPEPLIVFPHEKPFVAAGTDTLHTYRNYIEPVWKEARRLLANASQIHAIGYRFAPMDRQDVLGLLCAAKKGTRLIIQNRPETAEDICEYLKRKWLDPEGIALEPEAFPQRF